MTLSTSVRNFLPNPSKQILATLKKIVGIAMVSFSVCMFTYAQQDPRFNESFMAKLKANHINISTLETKSTISRYELARLLNLVECQDCLDPGIKMKEKYTQAFWSEFITLPGKDFRDIAFEQAFSKDDPTKSYYYCVAYVGDNEYMKGYPIATSPICRGNFCGDNPVTKAEFIQVVINIVEKYIYKNYKANRTEIKKRAESLSPEEYAARTLTEEDRATIANASKKCQGTACPLQSRYEFETYLKYCMFHLDACNFRPFGWIKQNYWPVAELNIMLKEGLIPIGDAPEKDIHKPIDGSYVLQVIGELHKKINCSFDPDYDCDGVPNWQDNCKNEYNPHQRDFDNDGIGNVCDEDIDNGGQKHPKGIVDDNDNIIISVLQNAGKPIEGNIFDKTDDNKNKEYDSSSRKDTITLDVKVQRISASQTQKNEENTKQHTPYLFVLSIQGLGENPDSIERDFGDGIKKTFSGQNLAFTFRQTTLETSIVHTYAPGTYEVGVMVTKGSQKAIAKTTLIVPKVFSEIMPLGINVTPTVAIYPSTLQLSSLFPSGFSLPQTYKLTWYHNENPIGTNEKILLSLTGPAINTITAKIYNTQGALKSIAQATYETALTFGRSSQLTVSTLMPKIKENVTIKTIPGGWTAKDIASITRYIGELSPRVNKDLTQIVSFNTPGTKVIMQAIVFLDGTTHVNYITIGVIGQNTSLETYLSFTSPEKVKYINTEIPFTLEITNVHPDEILKAIIDRNDGKVEEIQKHTREQLSPGSNIFKTLLTHTYMQGGKKNPTVILYLKNCRILHGQLTVYTIDQKDCYKAYMQNAFKSMYHCDMDQDGIPDMCDDDIDGDGKKNLLGIMTSENADCSLVLNNQEIPTGNSEKESDDGRKQKGGKNAFQGIKGNNINPYLLAQSIRGCTLDPCPFVKDNTCQIMRDILNSTNPKKSNKPLEQTLPASPNGKMLDENPNSLGKSEIQQEDLDTDKDGILDKNDTCPLLPETYNEKDDEDGCPELGKDNPCFSQEILPEVNIVPTNCNTCPCHFADIGGELLWSDTIRAVLMNTGGTLQYSRSFGQRRTK